MKMQAEVDAKIMHGFLGSTNPVTSLLMQDLFAKISSFWNNQVNLFWRLTKAFIATFIETPYQIVSAFQKGRSFQEAFGNALRWFLNPVSQADFFGESFLPEKVREARHNILSLASNCGFIKIVWEQSDRSRSNIIINIENPGEKGVGGVVATLAALNKIALSVEGFVENIQKQEYEIALPGSEKAKRLYFKIHGFFLYLLFSGFLYIFLYLAWLFVDCHDLHGGKELITLIGASFLLLSILRSVLMVGQVASAMKKDKSINIP